MIEKEPEIFYKLYPYDFWLNKANMLKSKIDSKGSASDDIGISGYGSDQKRYQRMLNYELHFTYFQQVEALFELLFALQKKDDKHIWLYLNNSKWHKNLKKIEKIATGELNIDSQKVELENGDKRSFLEWAFYAGIDHKMSKKDLQNTLTKAKRLIQQAAKDFVDRQSYNAYKHGLRILPLLDNDYLKDERITEAIGDNDFSNSFTYLDFEKDGSGFSEITVSYNPEQDIERINFMSLLMANMIRNRRSQFYKEDTLRFTAFSKLDPVDHIKGAHQRKKLVIEHKLPKRDMF
ncbi:MAG: hypothetical protein JJ953_04370 [Gracilimonas sp.]|uniref:hypothetical protein n=1 Tax=Gracilimonas sp. TaxID=1974203 RepID=UPI001B144BA7|nr:hypothetical protein [Gracilimonas sp.]MBO6585317.1 hypothetical protein [Gracilimonas sp.]MBO6616313.1 hypothetical protein [Gracilimonas sp.]